MSEPERQIVDRSVAGVISGRLSQSRWTLAAAAVAIGAVTVVTGGSWPAAVAAFAGVLVVAALAPRRTRAMRRADVAAASGQMPIDRLSALRLAAAVADPLVVFDRTGLIVHANPAAEVTFGPVLRGVDLQLRFRAPEMQELIREALSGDANGHAIDYSERLPIERLYRVSATPVGEGTGLGLSIVQAIVSAHAATLHASNRPEGGLDIEVRFPILDPAHMALPRSSIDSPRHLPKKGAQP
jgi:two-component system, OmpR family, phosphate regulon sensor histidine kinase PhoR